MNKGYDFSDYHQSNTQLDAYLKSNVEFATALLSGHGGKIYLYDQRSDELVLRAFCANETTGQKQIVQIGDRLKCNEGMAAEVMRTQTSLIVNDYLNYDKRIKRFKDYFRAVIEVPLLQDGEVIGIMCVFSKDGSKKFNQQADLLNLEAFAELSVLAIDAVMNQQSSSYLLERDRIVREFTRTISDTVNLEELADRILIELKKEIDYSKASIQLIRGDKRRIIAHKGFSIEDIDPKLLGPVSEDSLISEIIEDGKARILADCKSEDGWTIHPTTADVNSWIGIPLIIQGVAIGFLTIDHHERNYFKDIDVELLRQYTDFASIFVRWAKMMKEKERRITDLQAVNKVVKIINSQLGIEELFKTVVHQIKSIFDCKACVLYLREEPGNNTDLLQPKEVAGNGNERWKKEYRIGEGIIGKVFEEEDPMILDGETVVKYDDQSWKGPVSIVTTPIKIGDQVIGVILAEQPEFNYFDENDKSLIETLSLNVGIAIERLKGLDLIFQISGEVLTAADPEEVMKKILKSAITITNTDKGVLRIFDQKGEEVSHEYSYPHGEEFITHFRLKNSLSKELLFDKTIIEISDTAENDKVNPGVIEQGVRSILGLRVKSEHVLGTLFLDDNDYHEFTETEKILVKTLVNQAALAIEKSNGWPSEPIVFVAMPFGDLLKPVYQHILKPAIEEFDLKAIRSDEEHSAVRIMDEIDDYYSKSKFVIADLTSLNPNVLYEIGLAHGLRKHVVFISQHKSYCKSRLKGWRVIDYSNTIQSGEDLKIELKRVIEDQRSKYYSNTIHPYGQTYPVVKGLCMMALPKKKAALSGEIIATACSQRPHLNLINAFEAITTQQYLMDQIWKDLNRSEILIADLTGEDPDVFYLIGLARAIGKKIILLQKKGSETPFNVSGRTIIEYSSKGSHNAVAKLGEYLDL